MVLGSNQAVGGRTLAGDVEVDENTLVVFHCEIKILAMVYNVQSTGMMRGIVREATVQLVSRGLRLRRTPLQLLETKKKVARIHIYCLCIVFRCIVTCILNFENEVRASGGLEVQ